MRRASAPRDRISRAEEVRVAAAGLRDHRIGFLVLSLAGIGILGVMVFVTLQRELVKVTTARLRLALRGWD